VAPFRPRSLILILLATSAGIGGLAFGSLLPLPPPGLLPQTTANADVVDAQPAQVAVVDAATLRLQDRVVRLLGVDAPVRGATCRARDGAGFDCGAAATNALAELVRETPVACRLNGHDEMGRPYGVCEARGRDLNRAVIAAGWARADQALPRLKHDEDTARTERRGLWAAAPSATW
jgi:endonuclease YncB( thermonuclease family)